MGVRSMLDYRCEGCAALSKCQSYVGYGSVICTMNRIQNSQTKAELHKKQIDSAGYDKAIQDFYDKVLNFEDYIQPCDECDGMLLYSGKDITNMIVTIKEELCNKRG